ncbi:MAG: methyltransferase family protein [Bryobacteraceae bacterium]
MRATNWEFKNRALVFGLIFGCSFALYSLDPQNSAAALANWLSAKLAIDANLLARLLFAFAAFLLLLAALIRTWASSYLQAKVVYAADVKTESLVADGPYRHMRNPLYFANIFLALGLGAMMSRAGFFVAVAAMLVFCYRLIFREEADLEAGQGESYKRYRNAVPRLGPALGPRVPSAGRPAAWADGFRAEFWCWGIAVSVGAFAITLNSLVFLVILGISLAVFWFSSSLLRRNFKTPT